MMKFINERMFRQAVNAVVMLAAGFVIYNWLLAGFGSRAEQVVSAQQTDPFLSRRIDQVEQRFYGLESRLTRLEQDTRYSASTAPRTTGSSDTDIRLLRAELETMRLRLSETECGLAHLDERTLAPAAKLARKKPITDFCRQDTAAPVQLSARPGL